MYNTIFFNNVLRILNERKMNKNELAELSGVSTSFISDLTTGKANPSLKIMELIAKALEMPLPRLMESTNLDENRLAVLRESKISGRLPRGYERVSAILPKEQACQFKEWGMRTKKELEKLNLDRKNK